MSVSTRTSNLVLCVAAGLVGLASFAVIYSLSRRRTVTKTVSSESQLQDSPTINTANNTLDVYALTIKWGGVRPNVSPATLLTRALLKQEKLSGTADVIVVLQQELPEGSPAAHLGEVLPKGYDVVTHAAVVGRKQVMVLTIGARAGLDVVKRGTHQVIAESKVCDQSLLVCQRISTSGLEVLVLAGSLDTDDIVRQSQCNEVNALLARHSEVALAIILGDMANLLGGSGGVPLAGPITAATISDAAENSLVRALETVQGRLVLLGGDVLLAGAGATPSYRTLRKLFDFVPAEQLSQSLPSYRRTPGASEEDLRSLFFRLATKRVATGQGQAYEQRRLVGGLLQLGWPDTLGWRTRPGITATVVAYSALDSSHLSGDHAPVFISLQLHSKPKT
jgi:hypothetical protein